MECGKGDDGGAERDDVSVVDLEGVAVVGDVDVEELSLLAASTGYGSGV